MVDWTVSDHANRLEGDLAWLNGQVAALKADKDGDKRRKGKVIIFTQHSPTLHPRTADLRHRSSHVQAGLATNPGGEDKTRIVANHRSYYFSQADEFDISKIVEVWWLYYVKEVLKKSTQWASNISS
ncbi:hypothetical protein F5B21DRAFT_496798 [Xylaria acuta]|nr:hypothetical protein F5B21DRAFT_496798 [Xylaria acuta]